MAFIKVVRNRSYFVRYQVKYRRRREGKTDYAARRALIMQDKNKYNTPKYRLVVRFTNREVICQITRAKIEGDFVYTAAYGHELTKYGIPVGHSNYAAAYAVGLLVARRALTKFGIADKYKGADATGEDFSVTPLTDGPRPLRAVLDTGLKRTSTGSRVFAALKGACDGGLDIPHGVSRYAGYDAEGKKLKADVLREHIFGGHVADHMRELKEEDQATYEAKFSRYIKSKITADDIEDLYAAAHKAIRADPKPAAKKPEKAGAKHTRYHQKKITLAQRKGNVEHKKKHHLRTKSAAKDDAEDDDEEEADE